MLRPGHFIAAVLLLTPAAFAARQDGLVGYFTFDDENAPLKNSAPENGLVPMEGKRLGDAIGMTFAPGKFNRAAAFANTGGSARINDWAVSLGNLDKLYAGNFTVAFWMLVDKSQEGVVIGDKESFGIAPGWTVGQRSGNHYNLRTLGGSESKAYTFGLERKGWTHVALTVDRDRGDATFYIDGGKANHTYKLNDPKAVLGDNVATVVGAASNGTFGAKALVDELGIWNRVLSKTEIESLGRDDKDHVARRIPETSSLAWLGGAVALAGIAVRRRRRQSV